MREIESISKVECLKLRATGVIYLPFPRLVMSVVRVGCSVGQFRAQMGIMNDGIKMFHRENQHIQFEMT